MKKDVMSATSSTRRELLAATVAAGAASLLSAKLSLAAEDASIRPFHISVPEEQLVDLRRRIAATRWPEKETVTDASQGVQLATTEKLARYWASEHDWRKVEARLNALPQFITGIDGLDIHFIHVRSKHEKALPLIVTHGWPGSIIEQLKHRAAHRSDRAWRHRSGRLRHRDSITSGPWLLRQADGARGEPEAHR